MPWYVAHAIMVHKVKEGTQDIYPVWENMILVKANDHNEAMQKAEAAARTEEGDSEGHWAVDGRPASKVFYGIRKLMTLSTIGAEAIEPVDGVELSFNQMTVHGEEALTRLAKGQAVTVEYRDEQGDEA